MKFSIEKLKLGENKNTVYAGVFILILLLDTLLILKIQIRTTASTLVKIKKVSSELSTARKDIASLEDLSRRYDALKKNKDLQTKQSIYEDEVLSLLGDLSGLAEKNSVLITQIKPQKSGTFKEITSPLGKFFLLPINIEAESGYHNLGRFLEQIENDHRFMKVITLDINQNSRDYSHHLIKLRIGVLVTRR